MKVLITFLIGLLVVGCGEEQSTNTNDGNNTPAKSAKKKVEKTPSEVDNNSVPINLTQRFPLEGTWIGKSLEQNGEKVPLDVAMRMRFRFAEDKLFMTGNFEEERELEVTYKLYEKQEPKGIDLMRVEQKEPTLGIYQRIGDSLKVCIRKANIEKGRPTEFKTAPESGCILVVFALDGSGKNSAISNSVKELSLEEWIVGTYGDDPIKMVFLKNGVCESYVSGEKVDDAKWKAVDGEIHIINEGGISIARININGSLTEIAKIPKGGKRISTPKEFQLTLKKIKSEKETPSKGDDKNSTSEKPTKDLTAEEQKVIGSYVRKSGSKTRKLGLLENGKVESYLDGDKVREGSWKMAGNEVHINLIGVSVWRIESNGDLTAVASIKDEKREEAPIDRQATFKKIK